MITITLSRSELALARHLAHERIAVTGPTRTNDQMGHLDKSPGARETADINGVAGELAFAKAFNLWPDLDSSGPCVVDVTLPDGRTVDIKTTPVIGGNLIANLKAHKTDFLALVECQDHTFTIVGIALTSEVEKPEYMEPIQGRIVYLYPREKLTDVQWMMNQHPKPTLKAVVTISS